MLDKNAKMPTIHQAFPDLFDEQQQQQQDWRIMKEYMLDYANQNNKNYEGD